MAGKSTEAGRSVTSKVIAILMIFSDGGTYSLTEIARLTGLPISTAHRLSTELLTWGVLERTDDHQFRVGGQLRAIASHASWARTSFHERARQVMDDLSAAAGRGVVRLGVLDDLEVAYMKKGPDRPPVPAFFDCDTVPLHATAMGRALLAFNPPQLFKSVLARGLDRYTPYTCTSAKRLRHALSVIRLTRVAVCRREYEPDMSSVAVPVFGSAGAVVAALELTMPDREDLRLVQGPLVVAGRSLTRELQTGAERGPFVTSEQRHLDVMMNLAR